MNRIRPLRSLVILASLPVFALLFWTTALLMSNLPGLLAVGVNVHGLSLADYAGDSAQRPAPLSLRVLQDAQQDAGGGPGASLVLATPNTTPSGSVEPTPTPAPSLPVLPPVATPTPAPSLPLPPVATPTPTPGLLPLPLTSILPLPILPSLLPGLVK